MTTAIDTFARHQTVIAVLRGFRGFAKLAKWKGQSKSYRETHTVIEFTTEQNANGDFTDETRRAAEARATDLCRLLRAHGLTVNWNGSYAYTIEVKLDAPLIDVAAGVVTDDGFVTWSCD